MKKIALVVLLAGVMLLTILFLGAQSDPGTGRRAPDYLNKVTGTPVFTMINVNNVAAFYNSSGEQERLPSTGNSGLWYPRRTSTAIYSAGLVWGGYFEDGASPTGRVNGQSYNNGTKVGTIRGLRTGDDEDPNSPDVRIWRVRRDYATADLTSDAADFEYAGIPGAPNADAVKAQYETDWKEWPATKGAPFYDANGDGIYTPKFNADGTPMLFPDADEPGIAGADQVIWFACNDIGVTQPWTCPESGMEEQMTIWAYNRTDALGSTIFKKYRLIYKGTATTPVTAKINNMYLCQWADPDLGDSGDDFAGCDVNLSMSFVYNGKSVDANYAQFGLAPPASGYDFLQGPLVKGVAGQDLNRNGVDDAQDSSAIWDLKRKGKGWINLPMTSAIYFAAGGTYSDPPFTYPGAIGWYQMFRGLPPTPRASSFGGTITGLDSLTNPVTHRKTAFWLDGDPVTGQGWIDGSIDQPGDRRILLTSGPFTMALGDTQELVCAWVGGIGSSNLSSVSVMKFNDKSVQFAYDALFNLPKPPSAPVVRVTALDKEIILSWEDDSAAVAKTENPVYFGGFKFEGYNVYQLPTPANDITGINPIATYDLVNGITTIKQQEFDVTSGEILSLPVQLGKDTGIKRFISIKTDALRSLPLVNGQHYYFAVTAYSYSKEQDDAGQPTVSLESSAQTALCIPQSPDPGTRYSYSTGDTVKGISNVVGANDASIIPVIFNKTSQGGDTYLWKVDTAYLPKYVAWTLTNERTSTVVARRIMDSTGLDEHRIPDGGFSLYVGPIVKGMKSVTDPATGSSIFAGTETGSAQVVLSSDGTLGALAGLGTKADHNYQVRFDGTGSFALTGLGPLFIPKAVVRVPFSVWDVGRVAGDPQVQVMVSLTDLDTSGSWTVQRGSVTVGGKDYRPFDPIYITSMPYVDSATVWTQRIAIRKATNDPKDPNSAIVGAKIANQGATSTTPPATGAVFQFNKNLEIRTGDVKRIAPAKATIADPAIARNDVAQIKVFPNPYYGVNRAETDRVNRFVTFNHLPFYAKIRIFSLAGTLVRSLEKNGALGGDQESQFYRWDLQNQNGLPVASGIYIAYIEMRDAAGNDLGTKTVKFAIIQEQQFLRNY